MSFRTMILGSAALLLIAGCGVQTTQTYVINPNGSGKVEIDIAKPPNMNYDAATRPPLDKRTREELAGLLFKSQGVDAWKDVSIEPVGDGEQFRFKGTAYFSDLSKLEIANVVFAAFRYENRKGNARLVLDVKESAPTKMNRQDAEARADQEIAQWSKMKEKVEPMIAKTDITMTLRMPGRISAANGYKLQGNAATLHIAGEKLFAAMDKRNSDRKALIEDLVRGDRETTQRVFRQALIGNGKPAAIAAGAAQKIQFDYAQELAQARAAFPDAVQALGLEMPAAK